MVIVSIPFIINESYKLGYETEKVYSTLWEAKDLLGFYGSFLSFLGTVSLGALSLWQNQKFKIENDNNQAIMQQLNEYANQINKDLLILTEQNERRSVLPFLSFNKYRTIFKGDLLTSILTAPTEGETNSNDISIKDSLSRQDKIIEEINYSISLSKIQISNKLTEEQEDKIKSSFCINKQKEKVSVRKADYLYFKICVQNCGKGAAINLYCRLYKVGNEGIDYLDVYSLPFIIPIEKTFDLGIYIDFSDKFNGKYILQFYYDDIYSNSYTQKIPLDITSEEECKISLSSAQEFIKD